MPIRILLAIFLAAASLSGQTSAKHDLQRSCAILSPKHSDDGLTEFKLEKNDRYRNTPVVSFAIDSDGKVSDVRLVRSSGISRLDAKVMNAVKNWKFKPRPNCPVIDTQMSITIDWF